MVKVFHRFVLLASLFKKNLELRSLSPSHMASNDYPQEGQWRTYTTDTAQRQPGEPNKLSMPCYGVN